MPVSVGAMISTACKTGLKFAGDAPPKVVGLVQAASQAATALPSLQVVGIFPIPVIPAGQGINYILTMIEAMFNYSRVIIAKTRKKMLEQYTNEYKKALTSRAAAEVKLYNNLIKAQKVIIADVKSMKEKLKTMQIRLPEIQKEYEAGMAEYQKTILDYASKAKAADEQGDTEKVTYWKTQISDLDEWLASIILIKTEQITLTLDIKILQAEIEAKEPLTLIQLQKIWLTMSNTWSYMFDVAVPYYSDLPSYPNLPVMPPAFKIPQIVKCLSKGLAKWMTTPQLLPTGVAIDATLHCIMNLMPVNVPPLSAKMESISDSLIEQMSACI